MVAPYASILRWDELVVYLGFAKEDKLDERFTNLEVKVAFLEHHVEQLDELVRVALTRLEKMESEIKGLREQLAEGAKLGSPEEEVPPHHVRL